jgi:hypothetical protein
MACLALRFCELRQYFRMCRASLGENRFRAICGVLVADQRLWVEGLGEIHVISLEICSCNAKRGYISCEAARL